MSHGLKLAAQLLTVAATLATGVVGLSRVPDVFFLIVVAVLAALANAWIAISLFRSNRASRYRLAEVEDYMRKTVESPSSGKVAIFTHRMNWVKSDQTRKALRDKAEAGDLTIFTDTASKFEWLQKSGAVIRDYSSLGYALTTSFTITHHDDPRDATVHVGVTDPKDPNFKRIEKFSVKAHPTAWLAEDLKKVLDIVHSEKITT